MFNLTRDEVLAILSGPKRLAMALGILQFVASQSEGATCDECMTALKLSHQSASARYHELVKVGCLVPVGKRNTRSGALATVHKVSSSADFKSYIRTGSKQPKKNHGLSPSEQQVLTAGLMFIQKWNKAKSKRIREDAAVELVNQLVSLG